MARAGFFPVRWRRAAGAALTLAVALPVLAFAFRAPISDVLLGPVPYGALAEGSPVVLDRSGRLLRAFTTPDGRWKLPLAPGDVDPTYLALLKSFEDRRFDSHGGVDFRAMARAAGQALRHGRVVSGGSTLTMQVARLLEPREDRTLPAKLRQVLRAWQIEARHDKSAILGMYLALAPFGGNIEGVRAASLTYFGKEPKRLSTAEAALLVALPQSPESRRPDRYAEAARIARDRVLLLAGARGALSPADSLRGREEPVPTLRKPFPTIAPHIAESLVRTRPAQRIHELTLDGRLQVSLEALARERVEALGPKASIAILVVDNHTGAVRGHVGGADYFDAGRAGAMDLTQAVRSPGSALKPFIYGFAFDSGIAHPETILEDRPSRFSAYSPENFDLTFQGSVSARKALQQSLNVPAVELLADVGPARFLARMRSAGATIVLPRDAAPGLAAALGGLGIRLADLTRLYVGIARGGMTIPLVWRAESTATAGESRLFEPVAAWYVADALRGTPPPTNALGGRISFKTGTSYGYRDAWAAGFDRHHTVVVWTGRPDGAPVAGMTGRTVAAPILFDVFARIGGEPEALVPPRDALLVANGALPPPLRHLRKDAPKTAGTGLPQLRIVYPPDGARVDLGLAQGRERADLALKAQGGQLPLIWLVNGQPVREADLRRISSWQPDGAGFARVSVMDASGASDSVLVRLE